MSTYMLVIFSFCLLNLVTQSRAEEDDNIHIEVPEECKGLDFCSVRPKNYEKVEKRMNKLLPKYLLTNVENREGIPPIRIEKSPVNDTHNCPYIITEGLHYFTNIGHRYLPIVQTNSFTQSITMVKCDNEAISKNKNSLNDDECFQDLELRKSNKVPQCDEIKSMRTIWVSDESYKDIIVMPVYIPSACVCHIYDDETNII